PAPEEMADVRAHRVDLALLGVQGERVVASALLAPEGLVELPLQLASFRVEPRREVAVAPDVAGELGDPPLRVIDVSLHLARGDGRLRDGAVVEALRVVRVLPRLDLEPVLRSSVELDEAVAVEVAVLVDPTQRGQRGLLEVPCERDVVGPAEDLRDEDEVQRGRVDGAVVAGEPRLRGLALADLVRDLPRLRVDRRVVLLRLQLREHLERGARELGAEDQRLQARDDRVAPEYAHEP